MRLQFLTANGRIAMHRGFKHGLFIGLTRIPPERSMEF